MGFLGESSCLSKNLFCQSLPPSYLSSSHRRNSSEMMVPMASLQPENHNNRNIMKRKDFLFLGLSSLPFLQFRAIAVEGSVKEKQDMAMVEQVHQQDVPVNPMLSLLNEIGIVGLGVLGALYALAQKEKTTLESTIQAMSSKLNEEKSAMVALEKNFKKKLQSEQEEKYKEIQKVKEERTFLSSQLTSAKGALLELQEELRTKENIAQKFRAQVDHLQNVVAQAGEDKKMLEVELAQKQDTVDVLQERINLLSLEIKDKEMNIENLNSILARKKSEFRKLTSKSDQAKADLVEAISMVEQLKQELVKSSEELELKKSSEVDLNAKIEFLLAESNEICKKFHVLEGEYNDLKLSSVKEAASYSEILSNKESELNQLKEKLEIDLKEARSNQELIAKLTSERNSLWTELEKEVNSVKNLKGELQITQETLRESRLEAADLSEQLKQSKRSCDELMSEFLRSKADFAEAQKISSQNLDEVKLSSKVMSEELVSVKEALMKTKHELLIATNELKDVSEARESLKKELVEIYKKAEMAAHDLREEREVSTSLNKELEELRKQILNDREARRDLERDLEEATKSLDEMNRNALLLSRELEVTSSKFASLETEKNMFYMSLVEQKDATKEALDSLEDAQNLLSRLSKAKEDLERRTRKLDEELASAKGEILRLRRQIVTTEGTVNERGQQGNSDSAVDAPVTVKSNGRRRKIEPTTEFSQ